MPQNKESYNQFSEFWLLQQPHDHIMIQVLGNGCTFVTATVSHDCHLQPPQPVSNLQLAGSHKSQSLNTTP